MESHDQGPDVAAYERVLMCIPELWYIRRKRVRPSRQAHPIVCSSAFKCVCHEHKYPHAADDGQLTLLCVWAPSSRYGTLSPSPRRTDIAQQALTPVVPVKPHPSLGLETC